MTDNEIIKALECCVDYDCKNCTADDCKDPLRQALSLINRQKAEKEALIAEQETLQKYIAAQKAEIERLVKHTKEGIDLAKQLPEMLKLAQAEAIKEFAERLKEEADNIDIDREGDFISTASGEWKMWCTVGEWGKEIADNLVKEMVGEDNEKV